MSQIQLTHSKSERERETGVKVSERGVRQGRLCSRQMSSFTLRSRREREKEREREKAGKDLNGGCTTIAISTFSCCHTE